MDSMLCPKREATTGLAPLSVGCSTMCFNDPLRWKTIDRSHFSRSFLKPLRGQLPNRLPSSCQRTISSIQTSGHSTETALLSVTEALKTARAAAQSSALVLLDLAAFVSVKHRILLSILSMRTPGLNPTSLGARSTCHGKVSCLYLTASPLGCPKQGRTGGKKWPGSYCQTGPLNTRCVAHSMHRTF